ncbi:glycoside hydrolase family 27 protein, partial [Klebsiella pneumoniae]
KALADYAHGKGFKFGIYTVPGAKSCGGAEGGRLSDVATFAAWGVDYIKLDGCGTRITQSLAQTWRDAITATGRPMVLAINDDEIGQPWTW